MAAPAVEAPATAVIPRAAVRAEHLTKTYGTGEATVHALDRVTVEIEAGRFTAIMGQSGSGKSTLLHCIAGLDSPTGGRVWIGDTDITALDDRALTLLRRENVGFIFQSFNLLPTLDAESNILLPLRLAGKQPDRAWYDSVVDVLGLRDRLTHRPSELSGGQQQRVAVDSQSGLALLRFLRHSVDQLGQTVVMVTHDAQAASYADRTIRLADGRIVADERRK